MKKTFPLLFLLALYACALNPTKERPLYGGTAFGLAGCTIEVQKECQIIANRTFLSFGPRQVEYHSSDGKAFLWVGNKLVRGKWKIFKNLTGATSYCYEYEGQSRRVCPPKSFAALDVLSRAGDPYNLSKSDRPPFDLNTNRKHGFDLIDARLGR